MVEVKNGVEVGYLYVRSDGVVRSEAMSVVYILKFCSKKKLSMSPVCMSAFVTDIWMSLQADRSFSLSSLVRVGLNARALSLPSEDQPLAIRGA